MDLRKKNRFPKNLILIALTAAFLVSLTACADKRQAKELETTTYGIDVSRYQGTIDWEAVAQSAVEFAVIRVGYRTMSDGVIEEDPNARYNLQEASAAGVSLGVYFFSTAVTEEEAMEEAAWVADLIKKYPITYPVVYDCEGYENPESRQYGLGSGERTDIALAFLETIEKCGYEGMFYSSRNEMQDEAKWEMSRIDGDYKIWVAQYPSPAYPLTAASSYAGKHHMWQYTTEGSIPGISQSVDMNIAYFGYEGTEPPKDENPPEQVSPNPEAMHDFREVDELVTAKDATNLRSAPSQDADSLVLYTLQNGQVARQIAVSSTGWSKLEFEERIYYAVSSYLTTDLSYDAQAALADPDGDGIQTTFTPVSYQVTAKQKVNLRKLPSVEHEDAQVIAQLQNGDVASCVGVSNNGWSKLLYNGTTCYAVSSYLESLSAGSTPPQQETGEIQTKFEEINDLVTAKVEVNLRKLPSVEDPGAVVAAKLYHGDVVTRTGINYDVGWSRVIYNGQTLYCVSSYLEPAGE